MLLVFVDRQVNLLNVVKENKLYEILVEFCEILGVFQEPPEVRSPHKEGVYCLALSLVFVHRSLDEHYLVNPNYLAWFQLEWEPEIHLLLELLCDGPLETLVAFHVISLDANQGIRLLREKSLGGFSDRLNSFLKHVLVVVIANLDFSIHDEYDLVNVLVKSLD